MTGHVLAVRPDNNGDVLLAGPAIRALAAGSDRVTLLHGRRGGGAASLLPGVDDRVELTLPWIDPDPVPVTSRWMSEAADRIAALGVDAAVVFTSFHQDPLPTALLLRMAGVPFVGATSENYPGSLLDVRHRISDDVHEVRRALDLAGACGHALPPSDDDRLRVVSSGAVPPAVADLDRYVVVHPGATVQARTWHAEGHAHVVRRLREDGWSVVVTGGPDERGLAAAITPPGDPGVVDLTGGTDWDGLATVLQRADVVVVGNTGPAHLAAAVGTPVVSLFAPTVPAVRWRPWGVPSVLLGDQDVPCAGCRATTCPVAGHPCLSSVDPLAVVGAVRGLVDEEVVTA